MATRVAAAEEAGLIDPQVLEGLGIEPDDLNVRGSRALREATVYACIKILAEAVAKLPLKVYRESDKGIEKATGHPLYPLLKSRPNPYMTASDLFREIGRASCREIV